MYLLSQNILGVYFGGGIFLIVTPDSISEIRMRLAQFPEIPVTVISKF